MVVERALSIEESPSGSAADQEANPMAEMLEQYLSFQGLQHGQTVMGTVVRMGSDIIVDIGAKCEGVVPDHDLERLDPAVRKALQVGSEVLVYVVNPEDDGGNITLSLSLAQAARDWQEAAQLLESQEIIESEVVGSNKGGILVNVKRIRGFVPGSQLDSTRSAERATGDADGEERWAGLLGEKLQLKVIEVDQQRNRLILSERAALRDWRKNQRDRLLEELREGEVVQGRIINLANFGAFVDLGGVDGLVHLSELSWKRVSHPSEVVEVGQNVRVHILGVDRERQRISLSLKRLQPDPWDSACERYREGQLVEGTITHIAKWGAFASIVGDEAIEGLVHISELDHEPVVHPREVVKPGQTVTLRVISMDSENHRLSLSLKQVTAGEFLESDWQDALAEEQQDTDTSISVAYSEAVESSQDQPEGGG